MSYIRRGGFLFITWLGDHPPRHVHIYRDKELVAKVNLDSKEVMKGEISKRLAKIILQLEIEGLL